MVVPTNAASISKYAGSKRTTGTTTFFAAASQSGRARNAETMYVKYTVHTIRKIFSTRDAVPRTTSTQTRNAAIGTEMYLLTPKISIAEATPANSASTLPRLTTSTAAITKNVTRKPNLAPASE